MQVHLELAIFHSCWLANANSAQGYCVYSGILWSRDLTLWLEGIYFSTEDIPLFIFFFKYTATPPLIAFNTLDVDI